ncbi:hypothetical protein J5X91_11140 [Pseudoalteromonas sp. K222D]|uniref:hypothetical protein n=1 Tax=Pseudoalteromonas TaxID=53246 RepID=UPI001AD7BDA8|nr:hypothetical protein [Pseudoalteromonas sp. K222D]MBO7926817.1 hypothetical protein [Pseudoalteromonas sp. K222D]
MNTLVIHNPSYKIETACLLKKLLLVANSLLAASCALLITSILISYPFAGYFSIPVQISAHISTIIIAAILKISYVLRCIALHGMGKEVR